MISGRSCLSRDVQAVVLDQDLKVDKCHFSEGFLSVDLKI